MSAEERVASEELLKLLREHHLSPVETMYRPRNEDSGNLLELVKLAGFKLAA